MPGAEKRGFPVDPLPAGPEFAPLKEPSRVPMYPNATCFPSSAFPRDGASRRHSFSSSTLSRVDPGWSTPVLVDAGRPDAAIPTATLLHTIPPKLGIRHDGQPA